MNAFQRLPVLLVFAVLSGPGGAWAEEGWFGGIRVAPWINRADALLNLDHGVVSDTATRKPRTSSQSAASAHRFDVELAYQDGGSEGSTANNRNNASGRDFRLSGVGTWSLNDRLGLTGRLGAYRGDVDASSLYRLTPDVGTSLHPTIGMGLRFDISSNLRLQGGWDRYHLGVTLDPREGGVDLLTIGLKYRF